jgi:hypothetical protein
MSDNEQKTQKADELLDWLESCDEPWIKIMRGYDAEGNVYFRVKTCSRQLKRAGRGSTIREALQACVDQSNAHQTGEEEE